MLPPSLCLSVGPLSRPCKPILKYIDIEQEHQLVLQKSEAYGALLMKNCLRISILSRERQGASFFLRDPTSVGMTQLLNMLPPSQYFSVGPLSRPCKPILKYIDIEHEYQRALEKSEACSALEELPTDLNPLRMCL